MSLVQIRDQVHSIHMFYGRVYIRNSFENQVIMTEYEDGMLLKLKGSFARVHNFSCLSQHREGTLSYNLLWHARYGNLNYNSLCFLKKNGFYGFLTITKNIKQCDSCILGKHSKNPFHEFNLRACIKLELIHSDLCGPMPIISANGNKYLMNFVDDYTRMYWVYLLKKKSEAYGAFKKIHV